MIELTLFLITYVRVAARAFQQRNVVFDNWLWVIPTSYVMGYLELAGLAIGVVDIVNNGYWRIVVLGFASGSGGWLGCYTAIYLHKRLHR